MRTVHSCVGVYADLHNRLYCIRFDLLKTKDDRWLYQVFSVTDSQTTITIDNGVNVIVDLFQQRDKHSDLTAFNVLGNLNDPYADMLLRRRSPDHPLRFRFYDAVTEIDQCMSMLTNIMAEDRFKGDQNDITASLSQLKQLTPKDVKAIAVGDDAPNGPLYALLNSVALLEMNLMRYRSEAA